MQTNRRQAILGTLTALAAAFPLLGCAQAADDPSMTKVYVLGTIHSRHKSSELYSLGVLEAAIRKANPDVILTEIPPDRIAEAERSFRETGEVTEPRTQVFPEYTDVVFPLSKEMPFRIFGTAGWSREIADNRRAALKKIEDDPTRAGQWAEHLAARQQLNRDLAGRRDDPHFIHGDEYDPIVDRGQAPYQRYFDADLGPGGWTQINRAHTNLINAELDAISGKGMTVLITFGAWHKGAIVRSLEQRNDAVLLDPRQLF